MKYWNESSNQSYPVYVWRYVYVCVHAYVHIQVHNLKSSSTINLKLFTVSFQFPAAVVHM